MSSTFMQMGHDIATAQQMAHISISQQLVQQSTLSAFITLYRTYGIVMVCVFPLVFFLKNIKQG